MDLIILDTEETTTRTIHGGTAITVKTRVIVATPAVIDGEALEEEVGMAATPGDNDIWSLKAHPVFGDFSGATSMKSLFSNVVGWLNDMGVEVTPSTGERIAHILAEREYLIDKLSKIRGPRVELLP